MAEQFVDPAQARALVADRNFKMASSRNMRHENGIVLARIAVACRGMNAVHVERIGRAVERVEKAIAMSISPSDFAVLDRFGFTQPLSVIVGNLRIIWMEQGERSTRIRMAKDLFTARHNIPQITSSSPPLEPPNYVQQAMDLSARMQRTRTLSRGVLCTTMENSVLVRAIDELDEAAEAMRLRESAALKLVFKDRPMENYYSKPMAKFVADHPEIPVEIAVSCGSVRR
jgi:hypothetical protein